MNSKIMLLDGARILLAEDEPLIALDIADTLRAAGAEIVGPVTTVPKAIYLAETEEVSCAVLDIVLRDEEIYPVAGILHRKLSGIVFVTGVVDTARIMKEWPSAQVVIKPPSHPELIKAVMRACGRC